MKTCDHYSRFYDLQLYKVEKRIPNSLCRVLSNANCANFYSSDNPSNGLDSRGYFGLGAYGAVGADYHFSSRFYIGAEIGLQFMTGTTQDVEVDGTLVQSGFKFFDAGVNTMNSFRIGFKLL